MKVGLVNVNGRLSSDGSRLVSALLRRAGHNVKSAFIPEPGPPGDDFSALGEFFRDREMAFISIYSWAAPRAIRVTELVRRRFPGMKVIWGGPHCVSAPEMCLRWADAVCFSEDDQAVVEFVVCLGMRA